MIKKKIKNQYNLFMNCWLLLCYCLNWNNDWYNTLIWIYNKRNNNKRETIRIYKILQNILNKTSRNVWMHCW